MKKETVSMFNLEAAFKALDEIEAPKTSGERFKANRVNLKEYFSTKTAHEVLVEDYFDVNDTEDLNAAKEEREAEVAKAKLARIEKIVDLDAETEEDILPSYVGKMIMQCPQCMTLFYKNEEDIEKSEETPDVVNINEICQHCGNSSGYTLVGKVGGIDESEAENFDLDEIEIDENELDLDFPEEGTEEVDAEGTGEAGEAMEDAGEELDLDFDFEEEEQEEANESLHGSKLLDKIEDKNDLKTEIESEHLTLNEDAELMRGDASNKEPVDTFDIYIDKSGSGAQADKAAPMIKDFEAQHPDAKINVYYFDDFRYSEPLAAAKAGKQIIVYTDNDYTTNCPELADFENVTLINVMQENLEEDLADWYRKKFDRPASIATQQAWEDELNGEMGEISDKRRKHLERKFAQQRDWEERHPDKVPPVPTLKPVNSEVEEPVVVGESMHNSEILAKIEDKNELKTEIESDHLTLNEGDDYWRDRPYYDQSQRDKGVIKPYQKPAGYSGSQADWKRKCQDSQEMNRDLRRNPWESLEGEDKNLTEGAEDELFDKLWSQPQPTDAETEANLAAMNDSTVEEDFEELDDAFDEHITEYLKEVYSNIDSYNSTNCTMRGAKLIVEGLIKFQSGKTKTTRFTFDSNKRINNTLVFRGMNEGLTSERSAFRLACRADNKKLVTENLSYKYTIDGANVTGKTKKN